MDANLGYQNLKVDERLSYLTTFSCLFGRYRYKTGTCLNKKIYKLFQDLPDVFSTADDILVVGYDSNGKDHDETLREVLQICR